MSSKKDELAGGEPPAHVLPANMSDRTVRDLPFSLAIADAQLDDCPLIYVNKAFEALTGYASSAIIGRNCRFLQGENTSAEARGEIRAAIEEGRDATVDILNYRSDGSTFMNRLMIAPLRDERGAITHFLGIQTPSPDADPSQDKATRLSESLREVQHRVKNHLAMLLALIRMEAKQARDAKTALDVLANRVEALNMLYDEFARTGRFEGGRVALGAYVSRVCSALNMLDGKSEVRMNLATDDIESTLDTASQVGLLVSELLTNALQHGFGENDRGIVDVKLWQEDPTHLHLTVADDGRGMPEGSNWPQEGNLGSRIVRDLVRRLDGELEVATGPDGTRIDIRIPQKAVLAG